MQKMGFADAWVSLIMKCVKIVTYAVCMNNEMGESFKPMQGLRQGDPLSPYLFLIYSEGLSSGTIKGVNVCRRGPSITHLLFANDCILFGDATKIGAQNLKTILREYEICSSQCINFEKSLAYFSSNVSKQRREQIATLLGV
ncbi:reverse transcriptase [Gossypium australe]|uniref:Reverse transcriptase n=1 Tax=Gossypium australe TaxID=47621 RepID=A0A5B6W6M8_9ROSI|nr:reverse transcriptase [Gossypium australe]